MEQLFLQILNMSITSSYVILFVIVVRRLLKKAPKIFSYVLWSVVLFRLTCPFSFESIFSLTFVNTQTLSSDIMYSQKPQVQSGITMIDQAVNHSLPVPVADASINPIQIWIFVGEMVWIFGIVCLLLYSFFTVFRLHTQLEKARMISDSIYEINGIQTPFVFGILNPKIYLPIGLTENERKYIIKHEQTHIKRFDPIIKLIAFLLLCIHWFNPFVWIAFLLMSEDMELSCDESVIRQMGSEIKKEYSISLLSLSAGRRMIGGFPLSFGGNNIKGRVMNILNYKKPEFWVMVAALVAVAGVCIGLMSNPPQKKLTIEDYVDQFIQEEIKGYENAQWTEFKIIESKITKLEKIASLDKIFSDPIEIWSLEYRLKPDDINKVMLAGGMNEIDGWITEDSSAGKPMLVFSYKNSQPQYLGCIWSGENDLTKLSGQETALRIFLEGLELLPHETYSGNHILVKFPLSTGETCQLFLSQPIVQGDLGIWCVERWMDGNGNIYYETPMTDGLIEDYYKTLQQQCDEGHKPYLLDPLQVALNYINKDLGQYVFLDELVPQYSAKVEDFLETPESHFIGYISDFEIEKYSKPSFHLDQIEWLTEDDSKRLNELNINLDDLPNGYYIYNPNNYPMFCQVTNETQYYIINWGEEITHKSVSMKEFFKNLKHYSDFTPPFQVVMKDGYVQSITEQYIP